jgi:hypothetical protein
MSLIKYTLSFLAGVYIGQEFSTFPSVKENFNIYYNKFKESSFGKEFLENLKESKHN